MNETLKTVGNKLKALGYEENKMGLSTDIFCVDACYIKDGEFYMILKCLSTPHNKAIIDEIESRTHRLYDYDDISNAHDLIVHVTDVPLENAFVNYCYIGNTPYEFMVGANIWCGIILVLTHSRVAIVIEDTDNYITAKTVAYTNKTIEFVECDEGTLLFRKNIEESGVDAWDEVLVKSCNRVRFDINSDIDINNLLAQFDGDKTFKDGLRDMIKKKNASIIYSEMYKTVGVINRRYKEEVTLDLFKIEGSRLVKKYIFPVRELN
jgi:hypothetical protein